MPTLIRTKPVNAYAIAGWLQGAHRGYQAKLVMSTVQAGLSKFLQFVLKQVSEGYHVQQTARRPRWWRGNLFKAFYWACVGQPRTLSRKVDAARQQLNDIQAKIFRNTGTCFQSFAASLVHTTVRYRSSDGARETTKIALDQRQALPRHM